jgi:hypothetical protein
MVAIIIALRVPGGNLEITSLSSWLSLFVAILGILVGTLVSPTRFDPPATDTSEAGIRESPER